MQYWLMKSEPDAFSIDDLEAGGAEPWDGIRNYEARNFIRDAMRTGDRVLFYHSNCEPPGIVGIAEIASEPRPDPTAFESGAKYFDPKSDPDNPRWFLVDVAFVEKFGRIVPLSELREVPELDGMRLLQKGNRLSITPVTRAEYDCIVRLGRTG